VKLAEEVASHSLLKGECMADDIAARFVVSPTLLE
jgi:hypothetical protein